ncbi:MAG: type II toxin-antitoxin system HicB family antitoxin [Candidatus Lokiarchaeota archaeon]|nr:type II toxin-antitoxin system HicB family antitoxin [Candidatus Lokiarchaeota archaeon]
MRDSRRPRKSRISGKTCFRNGIQKPVGAKSCLPGCVSQGKTKEEAIINIKEAIDGYIKALEDDRLPVPEERFDEMLVAV